MTIDLSPWLFTFQEDNDNDGIYWENGHLPGDTRSLGSPYRRSNSAHDVHRRPISEYASPEGFYTGNFGGNISKLFSSKQHSTQVANIVYF